MNGIVIEPSSVIALFGPVQTGRSVIQALLRDAVFTCQGVVHQLCIRLLDYWFLL